MSDHPVTLTLPDHIYDRVRQAADAADQPIERILLQHLEEAFSPSLPVLPPDEQAEMDALTHLSDDALWTIAREQMPDDRQVQMQALMGQNSQGELDESGQEALRALVELGQRLILRKARAAALLAERGHSVTARMLTPGSD